MRRSIIASLFSLAFLSSTLCAGEPAHLGSLRVLAILPLSGDAAAVGQAFQNGINLALEQLPEEIQRRIEVSYEDDSFTSRNAVSAFNKVINTKGTDLLINAGSGTGNALAPLAEANKVAFLSIASDKRISDGRKYVFNFWVTPREEAKVAVSEALSRGYKNIARIGTQHEGVLAVKSGFDPVNAGRLNIVLDEEFPAGVSNFGPFIARLRRTQNVDAVMVVLLPGQCGLFAKQMREGGLRHELFGVEVFEDPNEVKASQGALVNQWYINAEEPDETFSSEYRRHFPGASMWGALNAHDAILLAAGAIRQGYRPADFYKFLEELKDFKGALGRYSANGDHTFTLPATVKVVTATGFEKMRK